MIIFKTHLGNSTGKKVVVDVSVFESVKIYKKHFVFCTNILNIFTFSVFSGIFAISGHLKKNFMSQISHKLILTYTQIRNY